MQAHIDELLALADRLSKDDIKMLIEKAFLDGVTYEKQSQVDRSINWRRNKS